MHKMRIPSLLLLIVASQGFVHTNLGSRSADLGIGKTARHMMPLNKGSTVALITPFTSNGEIDVPNLKKLLDMHLEQGTDNLCVLGTTAEAATMTMAERELALKTIMGKVKGKIPVMVGTGTINQNSVKAMTRQAIDLGADGNLLVSPYYVKPPQRSLIRIFTETADMGLPVILYNVPGRTSVDMTDETVAICAEHENIVGIKDATGDLSRLASLKQRLGENSEFLIYSGDDGSTMDFVLQGGDGCISVTANLAPKAMHDMVHAALKGDAALAQQLNAPLEALHSKLFVESNPIPVKWAANRAGLTSTPMCRLPLDTLDPKYEGVVEDALRQAGLI